jgi:cytochrome b
MKTYIWTIPTRLFHWLLAISFAVAFLSGGEEEYLNTHAAFGILIGGLILFRLLQGLFGPRYARFSDFPVTPGKLTGFLKDMKMSKLQHPGHNPLAALVMLGIMIAALLSAISGMLLAESSGTALFGLNFSTSMDQDRLEEFHEFIVHLFLVLVGIHLSGIIVDTLFHSEHKTVFSIFTGYKKMDGKPAVNNLWQIAFSAVGLILPVLLFFYIIGSQPVKAGDSEKTEQHEAGDND